MPGEITTAVKSIQNSSNFGATDVFVTGCIANLLHAIILCRAILFLSLYQFLTSWPLFIGKVVRGRWNIKKFN